MSKHLSIIVGSMLGAAEYVADALDEVAKRAGYTTSIHLEPNLNDISVDSTWLVCTSTHGAGDLPDNIQPFAKQLKETELDQVKTYIIGLGDSSYDTYCYGAIEMEKILLQSGASLIHPPLHIDVLNHPIPEDKAVEWFEDVLADQ
ncbi:FMN-binding protein MioC [Salinimonas sp. HHU 13199]|uniref:FMN-binding protein MioC n=1 Tax=Salinimonas profundi TaxID=2729140 RepID=A0ABR8LN28_9ALTE|nr:FMN-binding protein MioC [Salinimonas profundi]MBD3585807.1 FMN-binding protein MioC [Salinimonas profundi]